MQHLVFIFVLTCCADLIRVASPNALLPKIGAGANRRSQCLSLFDFFSGASPRCRPRISWRKSTRGAWLCVYVRRGLGEDCGELRVKSEELESGNNGASFGSTYKEKEWQNQKKRLPAGNKYKNLIKSQPICHSHCFGNLKKSSDPDSSLSEIRKQTEKPN